MLKADNVTLKLHIDKCTDDNQHTLVLMLFNLVLSACAFFGFGGAFCNLFDIRLNAPAVMTSACLSSAALIFTGKNLYFAKLLPAVSIVTLIIAFWSYIANGFAYTANNVLDAIGCRFARIMPQLEIISRNGGAETTSQTLFFISLSILISYSIVFSVIRNDVVIPLFLTTITIASIILMDSTPPVCYILSSALYVVGIMLKRFSGSKVSVLSLTVCGVICALLTLIFYISGIESCFTDIKSDVQNSISKLRYGKSDVMPEGDFSELSGFEPTGKQQLEVIMSRPDSLYLKGFVGASYNGSGWDNLNPAEYYKSADLFYWLHRGNFYGQNQLALASEVTQNVSDNLNKITINNKGASKKYTFFPYELLSAESLDKNMIDDGSLKTTGLMGAEIYTINAVENQIKCYPDILKSLKESKTVEVKTYLNNESHYRDFVYDAYLDIPENVRNVLRNQLGEYDLDNAGRLAYSKAQQNILSYLSSKVSYNNKVSFSDENGDFIQFFLEQSCEGYSLHYATAATLMFRYYGIPARYVEGFLITPDDVKSTIANSPINVDDNKFHAWVEFYRDGIGWIPFETTPPYLNAMEKAEEIAALPDSNKDSGDNGTNNPDSAEDVEQGLIKSTEINDNNNKLVIAVFSAAVALIILFLVIICVFRRLKLIKKLKAFNRLDNKTSVILMFAYIYDLLMLTGYIINENQLYNIDSALHSRLNLSDSLKSAIPVYEKARFSKHEITDSEKQAVSALLANATEQIKADNNLIKNLYYRFIKCCYR